MTLPPCRSRMTREVKLLVGDISAAQRNFDAATECFKPNDGRETVASFNGSYLTIERTTNHQHINTNCTLWSFDNWNMCTIRCSLDQLFNATALNTDRTIRCPYQQALYAEPCVASWPTIFVWIEADEDELKEHGTLNPRKLTRSLAVDRFLNADFVCREKDFKALAYQGIMSFLNFERFCLDHKPGRAICAAHRKARIN